MYIFLLLTHIDKTKMLSLLSFFCENCQEWKEPIKMKNNRRTQNPKFYCKDCQKYSKTANAKKSVKGQKQVRFKCERCDKFNTLGLCRDFLGNEFGTELYCDACTTDVGFNDVGWAWGRWYWPF